MLENELLVVKISGSGDVDLETIFQDIKELVRQGFSLIVVHGGSARANQLCEEMGYPPHFIESPSGHLSRYTNERTRELYVQATTELNTEITTGLQQIGVRAIGLSGRERSVILSERKPAIRAVVNGRVRVIRDDYSGRITVVNTDRLYHILISGVVPVIPPVAHSLADGLLNVDGDRTSAAVAGALGADQLILLSNVPGLLRSYPEENSLVSRVSREGLEQALQWAQGRMKRKVISVQEALDDGVMTAVVADGRLSQPIHRALAGGGTRFG
jgi:acetylglutamate/LysW-gamma-L-alpha-aminoadipate kinase